MVTSKIRISKIPSIKRKIVSTLKSQTIIFGNPCNKNDVTMMFIYPFKKMKTLENLCL